MHHAGEKIIPITNSDDKCQVTAIFAASLTGEFLAPKQSTRARQSDPHPKVSVPTGWDIWYSDNHWPIEDTMWKKP